MGKRKLKFDVRKNSDQKRARLEHLEIVLLIVRVPLSAYTAAKVDDATTLLSRLVATSVVPKGWVLVEEGTRIVHQETCSPLLLYKPIENHILVAASGVTCYLAISDNLEWTMRIGVTGIVLDEFSVFEGFLPLVGCLEQVVKILNRRDESAFCVANADGKFTGLVKKHKGCFRDCGTNVVAQFDTRALPAPTIRHHNCSLLVLTDSLRCRQCTEYRRTLHAMVSRGTKITDKDQLATCSSSHTNYRYLSTPEKHTRMALLHKENRAAQLKVEGLKKNLSNLMDKKGVSLENSMTTDLQQVMEEEEHKALKDVQPGTFQHIFWQQQKEAAGRDKRGMRWHPAMIKWCLFLRHQSSKAYETLRQSGCIQLPSQRTLRDYYQCVKAGAGFSATVDHQLLKAANQATCEPWKKLVVLLLDEMYIRCGLVYEKHTKKLVGITSLGVVNDHLLAFEKSLEEDGDSDDLDELAKTMMVFMVRGLFTRLRFPYAQFPCASVSGDLLYHPFWQAIFRLERMEFKVLGATFDGASINRPLVKVHDLKAKLTFKVKNVHSKENRDLFFFSDPPHLIKTTRNCWSSPTRLLWNQQDIAWSYLLSLYNHDTGKASGLAMVPKLKYEHVHLNSFSKMRVDLAAQVLSESVAKALPLVVGQKAAETAEFVLLFDKFFDVLNVTNFTSGATSRKPFLHPYRSRDDERLKWLEETFLPYLDNWEKHVDARKGFTKTEKKRMILSDETLLGLRMTANSFIGLVRYLFSMPEVKDRHLAFLSNNLCQDPLEGFFGCQRQRGGTSDNPSVHEFSKNTAALRVVNSFCRNSITGNCRRTKGESRTRVLSQEEIAPLPKAPRRRRLLTN